MFNAKLGKWLGMAPIPGKEPEVDALAMQHHVAVGETLLGELPLKAERSIAQQDIADAIHRSNRAVRAAFLAVHVIWIYDELTFQRKSSVRLRELSDMAATMFPGLVPTYAQITQERLYIQKDKEGREIDQGIFFAAVMGNPECGTHLIESMLRPTALAVELLPAFCRDGRIELSKVHIERSGDTAHVTIHNQACLNAEDDQLIADLETAVDLVLLDDKVRVASLRGGEMSHPKYAGRRVFSAGINLRELHRGRISFVDFLLGRELGYINKILRGLIVDQTTIGFGIGKIEKPWIAAVDTFAIGGGAQLLLVFDKVIAGSNSYFSLPAAQEGIIPGVASLRLGRAVGARKARQIILSGYKVEALHQDAQLLFDEVVAPCSVGEAIETSAALLNGPAVVANRHMLTLAEEPIDLFRCYMAEFALEQAYRMYSDDVLDKVARA
ncbi:enoyl-CoA hydratase/isomerase family protein [Collimonas pratensis]|uniref:(3,5-dihydroxyphenyl)acetyl-CoA 1,2-dioxygenase DpgC n=1 Tax=Collimonas pratensis TaxID=279113 RepID=UPI00143DDAA7|nr:(3,5-dihydroxyphenyl)acetyl-CoA 1,2-dioxygenase DpgC [Collimonas pratensis]NKI71175.1 enoyl-CoA hydratase/isomerase family protein [Collimonas pratensis]